jgi:hypothetical protein
MMFRKSENPAHMGQGFQDWFLMLFESSESK